MHCMTSTSPEKASWSSPQTRSEADDIASRLNISRAKLARVIRVHSSTLSRPHLSSRAQSAFVPLIEILNRVTATAGQEWRAVTWFNHIPILAMGDLPAIEHIANGDAETVLEFLDCTEDGIYS